jgi:hypothetical protein
MSAHSQVLLLAVIGLAGCGRDVAVPASGPAPSPTQPIVKHSESPMNTEDWPFSLPQDTAVFTLKRIVFDSKPILYVAHDEDGDWQFLDGEAATEDDAAIVRLEEIVERDPTVTSLADLPEGWSAERTAVGAAWKRMEP